MATQITLHPDLISVPAMPRNSEPVKDCQAEMTDLIEVSLSLQERFQSDNREQWEAARKSMLGHEEMGVKFFEDLDEAIIRQLVYMGIAPATPGGRFDRTAFADLSEYDEAHSYVWSQVFRLEGESPSEQTPSDQSRLDQPPSDESPIGQSLSDSSIDGCPTEDEAYEVDELDDSERDARANKVPPLVTAMRAFDAYKGSAPIHCWDFLIRFRVRPCLMKWGERRMGKPRDQLGNSIQTRDGEELTFEDRQESGEPTAEQSVSHQQVQQWMSKVLLELCTHNKQHAAVFLLRHWLLPEFPAEWREKFKPVLLEVAAEKGNRTEEEFDDLLQRFCDSRTAERAEQVDQSADGQTKLEQLQSRIDYHHTAYLRDHEQKRYYARRFLNESDGTTRELFGDCHQSVGQPKSSIEDRFKSLEIYKKGKGFGVIANVKVYLNRRFCLSCSREGYHLKTRNKQIVELSGKQDLDSLKQSEIAEILGISSANVGACAHRANLYLAEYSTWKLELTAASRREDYLAEGLEFFKSRSKKQDKAKAEQEIQNYLLKEVCGEFEELDS